MEEKEFNLNKFQPNKNLLIIISILIIIPLLLLLFIKFSPTNRQISKLKSIAADIEEINLSLLHAKTTSSIDSVKSEELLRSGLSNLKSIENTLLSIDVNEDNKRLKANLKETLDCNINLYSSTLSLFSNPDKENFQSLFLNFEKDITSLNESSTKLCELGIPYNFSGDPKTFFLSCKYYFNELIKINREDDIRSEQNRAFYFKADTILTSFNSINEDMEPSITRFKELNKDLLPLIDNVKSKKEKLLTLKNDLYTISVPENCNEEFKLLQGTITAYENYINDLDYTLKTDNRPTTDYKNVYSKYKDFLACWNMSRESLDNLKNK